ncbi:MAG: cytochrome c5 family protein [Thiomargarita sp.]|nr:cytochrome c5 family protein [Thiomargarita sp.]
MNLRYKNKLILILFSYVLTACNSEIDLSEYDLSQGKKVYENLCLACHMVGMSGIAPKISNTSQWEYRIKQGMNVLIEHSINGFKEMPAKGGNPDLSDQEIKNAVAFMVSESL